MEGEGQGAERVYVPRTDNEKESIKKLVISSIGIKETRGDTIEVINIPFDTSYLDEQQKQLGEMRRAENIKMFTPGNEIKIVGM